MVCPPFYTLCPDLRCIRGTILDCIDFDKDLYKVSKTFGTTPTVRCPDYSYAVSFDLCPSLKVCSDPTQLVCPDGTCKADYSLCGSPIECINPVFPFWCKNGRCVKDRESCWWGVVCGPGKVLCETGC